MPKPRKTSDLPVPRIANDHDAESLAKIVQALNYLHKEAAQRQIHEIADVVEAAVNIISVAYRLLPLENLRLPDSDVQRLPPKILPHKVQDLESLVSAMDFLARKAETIGAPDASIVISSAFQILCASYYCILRHNMLDLPADGD